MRRLDSAQIVKLVTLARHDKTIGLWSALHDGDRAPTDLVEDLLPPRTKLLVREVALVPDASLAKSRGWNGE